MFVVDQNGNLTTVEYIDNSTSVRSGTYRYKDFFKAIPSIDYVSADDEETRQNYEEFPYRTSLNIEDSYVLPNVSKPGKSKYGPAIDINVMFMHNGGSSSISIDLTGETLALSSVNITNRLTDTLFSFEFYNGTLILSSSSGDMSGFGMYNGTLIANSGYLSVGSIPLNYLGDGYESLLSYKFKNVDILNYNATYYSIGLLSIVNNVNFRATILPINTPVVTKKYTFEGYEINKLKNTTNELHRGISVKEVNIIDKYVDPIITFDSKSGDVLVLEDFVFTGGGDNTILKIEI